MSEADDRVCLNMLRSRDRWREALFGVRIPDPIVTAEGSPRCPRNNTCAAGHLSINDIVIR